MGSIVLKKWSCVICPFAILQSSIVQGTSNKAAGILSYIDWPEISTTVVNQVLNVHLEEGHPVTRFCYGQQVIPVELDQLGSNSLGQDTDWVEEQDNDPVIRELKLRLSQKMK